MKKTLIISLSINLIILCVFAGKRYYYSYGPGKGIGLNLAPDQFRAMLTNEKLTQYNAMPIDTNDIVFIGTSITEAFPISEMAQSADIKNRGISGNTSIDILNRIESIIKGHPKKIFIEMGINDIIKKQSEDTLLMNYNLLISKIKHESPTTAIYIHSLLPTDGEYAPCYPQVVDFNKQLKRFCDTNNIAFIDLFRIFNDGNKINDAYAYDGVHPTIEGYKVWQNAIGPYLN